MKEKIISILRENPWIGTSAIAKSLETESKTIAPVMKEMLVANEIVKTGERRGSKYALPDAPARSLSRDLSSEVLSYIEASGPVSRLQIRNSLSTEGVTVYDQQVMAVLNPLIDEGKVESNKKKKGQMFWTPGTEVSDVAVESNPIDEQIIDCLNGGPKTRSQIVSATNSYDAKVKKTLDRLLDDGKIHSNGQKRKEVYWVGTDDYAIPENIANGGKPIINSMTELIALTLDHLPERIGYQQNELSKMANDSAEHPFSALQVSDAIMNAIKRGTHGLQYRSERTDCGYYIKVYKGSMPSLE